MTYLPLPSLDGLDFIFQTLRLVTLLKMLSGSTDLEDDVDQNDKERVGEREEEPGLYGFDVGGAGQAGRD